MEKDFLDNAMDKAKAVAETAYKKTGDFVSKEKQKLDIAVMENKLGKLYETLGKLYFATASDTELEDGEIKDNIELIKEKLEKINAAKTTLAESENKKICPTCGKAISKSAVFCSFCGEKIDSIQE